MLNQSLAGLAQAVAEKSGFGNIYGALHGVEGLLNNNMVELGCINETKWHGIARTPGAILGSTRHKLLREEIEVALDVIKKGDIGYCFIIGGNDSAETGHLIGSGARKTGLSLKVINIPKTIDNDLVETDHSPGYGSAARFVAEATMGIGRDVESMGSSAPIAILEVMGRDAGWLASASVLGKRDERDAPHIIVIPEVPVSIERFIGMMEETYSKHGIAVAVVAENARSEHGVLGGENPWYVDDFGHAYFAGAGKYLAELLGRKMGIRVRYEKPGTIQRSMITTISRIDATEAKMAGRAAVIYAETGESDVMVTLQRVQSENYHCVTGTVSIEEVAGKVKTIPDFMYDKIRYLPTPAFVRYAMPLIGGTLPRMERL